MCVRVCVRVYAYVCVCRRVVVTDENGVMKEREKAAEDHCVFRLSCPLSFPRSLSRCTTVAKCDLMQCPL